MSLKETIQQSIKTAFLISGLGLLGLIAVVGQLVSAMSAAFDASCDYLVSPGLMWFAWALYVSLTSSLLIYRWRLDSKTMAQCLLSACIIGFIALNVLFFSDLFFIRYTTDYANFPAKLDLYIDQQWTFYVTAVLYELALLVYTLWYCTVKVRAVLSELIGVDGVLLGFSLPFLMVVPFLVLRCTYFIGANSAVLYTFSGLVTLQNSVVVGCEVILLAVGLYLRASLSFSSRGLANYARLMAMAAMLLILAQLMTTILQNQHLSVLRLWSSQEAMSNVFHLLKETGLTYVPWILWFVMGRVSYSVFKKAADDYTQEGDTSKAYGGARWATEADLKKHRCYDNTLGQLIGMDKNHKPIYHKLTNKLTLSPPGGGKTTCSSIPLLLNHTGPIFALDIKGELFATTAKYRWEVLKRKPILLDPFGIMQSPSFKSQLPPELIQTHTINPFDWLPEDRLIRDRMLNAFAASLVINESGHMNHFDENAKILIRGYIDFLMTQPKASRNLPELFRLCSESIEESQDTMAQMMASGGRAQSAANQIGRVGADERGSILSTTYRQIDWLGDSNVEHVLTKSSFDLNEFLKGHMDIYVVLPVDQVKEHGRFFRMVMCLLVNLINQADPSQLPKQDMVFLIDEIAQLGPSEDVEQAIEVLRARGVILWAVFQTLAQIKQFKKPDLFLTMPVLQVFRNKDNDTMEWIQKTGCDRTILTKTLSTNSGDSRQKMQTFGGSVSKGEGESVHEAGVKLITQDLISVMPEDEQLVFIDGLQPISCKKIRYFDHPLFAGKFSNNPLETRKSNGVKADNFKLKGTNNVVT